MEVKNARGTLWRGVQDGCPHGRPGPQWHWEAAAPHRQNERPHRDCHQWHGVRGCALPKHRCRLRPHRDPAHAVRCHPRGWGHLCCDHWASCRPIPQMSISAHTGAAREASAWAQHVCARSLHSDENCFLSATVCLKP